MKIVKTRVSTYSSWDFKTLDFSWHCLVESIIFESLAANFGPP